MSEKITLELNPKQVYELIERLSLQDKIRLFKKLERQTWAKRLDEVVHKIRRRFKENPISDKEITRICKETRRKIYNEKSSRHSR